MFHKSIITHHFVVGFPLYNNVAIDNMPKFSDSAYVLQRYLPFQTEKKTEVEKKRGNSIVTK